MNRSINAPKRGGLIAALACLGILVLSIVVWPLVKLVSTAATSAPSPTQGISTMFQATTATAIGNSVWSAAAATVAGLLIGYGVAWALHGASRNITRWGHIAAMLPLLIPPFIGAFSWVQSYAAAGTADWLLHWHWNGLFGPLGVIILLAVHSAPLGYLGVKSALDRVEMAPKRAAQIYGAGSLLIFRVVIWPVLRPSLLAVAGLIFAFNLGDFGIPFELGVPAHFQTATTQIYSDLTNELTNGLSIAVGLSIVLSLISVGTLLLVQRLTRTEITTTQNLSRIAPGRPSPTKRLALVAFGLYCVITVVIPFISTVLVSLTRAYGLTPKPANWDVHELVSVFSGDTGTAARNSLLLSAMAAVIVVVLNLIVAEVAIESRLGWVINRIAWLPYALPGSVLSVAVILSDSKALYGTLMIILVAYIARFWGLGEGIVQTRTQIPTHPIRAARIFGGSPRVAYHIAIWPYLASAAQTCAIMVFVSAIYELTISSLLYTPASETMAVVVLSANQSGDIRTTAIISVWMTVLMLAAVVGLTFMPTRADQTDKTNVAEEGAASKSDKHRRNVTGELVQNGW